MNRETSKYLQLKELQRKLRMAGSRIDYVRVESLKYKHNKPLVIEIVAAKTNDGEPVL